MFPLGGLQEERVGVGLHLGEWSALSRTAAGVRMWAQRGDGIDGLLGGLRDVRVSRWVRDGCWARPGRLLAALGALGAEDAGSAGAEGASGGQRVTHGRSTSPVRPGGGRDSDDAAGTAGRTTTNSPRQGGSPAV
ncbi:hypothetical protein [Kitasatospora sp. NPDC087314]|uniref:hypothetical protein n=1 Tax=Kitasatospora sp. NPDC087314 TaxID=3364068 RepID=UPI0037FF9669